MVLTYHNIAGYKNANTVSLNVFEDQLLLLLKKGYQIVSIDGYIKNLKSNHKQKQVAITFDDGFINIKTKVLPVIKKHNAHITIFLPVNLIGTEYAWKDEKIQILSWNDIRVMNECPLVSFGSHTCNHFSLGHLTEAERKKELCESKTILEKELQCSVNYFAYPFGQREHLGKKSDPFLAECGYSAAFTTNWSRQNSIRNIFFLNRIDMATFDDTESFERFLNNRIDLKHCKQRIKNIQFRIGLRT